MSDANSMNLEAFEAVKDKARKQGFHVVVADDYHLLLDLDDDRAYARFQSVMPLLAEKFGGIILATWASRNGNRHIHVSLQAPHGPIFRIALQAILGSDPVRELLSLVQIEHGVPDPSILFKPGPYR